MLKNLKYSVVIISVMISLIFLPSCKDFLNPPQELKLTQDQLFNDWFEYRAVGMGLYGLQSKLVEQLVILGELRGDLMTVTPNADADLVEINNFKVSKTNKYASPVNFFKLIAGCNNLIRVLKDKHPEVIDLKNTNTSNYDKLYGEALCMRAWAYFNAVRIYGKVPLIYESLTTVEEIEQYLNSASTYRDTTTVYKTDGFNYVKHDTIINLTKQYYDINMVESVFINQLETEIKAVGVDYNADKDDGAWEITVWNTFAWHALLGQMCLTQGNLSKAKVHLEAIAKFQSTDYRYQINYLFRTNNWRNIFTGVPDIHEHIFTLQFNKDKQEQNGFQRLFDFSTPGEYMLKPTKAAILNWEGLWRGYNLIVNTATPALTRLDPINPGIVGGDFYRGYGTSYYYQKNGMAISGNEYLKMLTAKSENDVRTYTSMMDGVDTIIYKYSINKGSYDQDANFIVYRAGGIHLELAEIYTWLSENINGQQSARPNTALGIVNDGSYYSVLANRVQLGIRGRVGYNTSPYDLISTNNIIYQMDPNTNKVLGYVDYSNNLLKKQTYLEEQIMDEKARELAYEGERFYDLMRVAKRRKSYLPNDDYLAKKVSAKYSGTQKTAIYNLLLDEKNWYINMFN
jgi:starch-binding outer membrane protein, SusD/RagB family